MWKPAPLDLGKPHYIAIADAIEADIGNATLLSGTVGRGTFVSADIGVPTTLGGPQVGSAALIEMGLTLPLYACESRLAEELRKSSPPFPSRTFSAIRIPAASRCIRRSEPSGYRAAASMPNTKTYSSRRAPQAPSRAASPPSCGRAILAAIWMSSPLNAAALAGLLASGAAEEVLDLKRAESRRRVQLARSILPGGELHCQDSGFF